LIISTGTFELCTIVFDTLPRSIFVLSSMLIATGIKKMEKHPNGEENILLDFMLIS